MHKKEEENYQNTEEKLKDYGKKNLNNSKLKNYNKSMPTKDYKQKKHTSNRSFKKKKKDY